MIVQENQLLNFQELLKAPCLIKSQLPLQNKAKGIFEELIKTDKKKLGFDYVLFKNLQEKTDLLSLELNMNMQPNTIVLVDGVYSSQLSDPKLPITAIKDNNPFLPLINKNSMEALEMTKNPFVALNFSIDSYGLMLLLDDKIKEPITILNITTQLLPTNFSARLSLQTRQMAQADVRIIHRHLGEKSSFFNLVTTVQVEKNSQLNVTEVVESEAVGFHQCFIQVKGKGKYQHQLINDHSKFYRSDFTVKLLEPYADAKLFGLNVTSEDSQAHFFANVCHLDEETTSYQHVKNISFDRSRTSFEGKIYVDQKAQKTQAYQLNQNLVLSEKAFNFSKPNLEIYADDVKASHGATFTKLSQEELFYLKSRGISPKVAETMLIESFIREFLELIPDQALKDELMKHIFQKILKV